MRTERTIYVVDDDLVLLESVALLLVCNGYAVKTFRSGVAFLAQAAGAEPGCLLLDIHMPELSGMDVLERLNGQAQRFAVVMLTGKGDVAAAVRAMKWGVVDFIEKPYSADALLTAVREAFVRLESATADDHAVEDAKIRIAQLSGREREVLQRLLSGWPNKVIAYQLGLSTRTVEMHRANIMDKLQARGLSMAVRMGLAAGLVPVDAEPLHPGPGELPTNPVQDRRITTMRY